MTRKHDEMHRLLDRIGVRPQVADAVERLDTVFQNLRRQLSKRELGHKAIAALSLDIDMAQLDILYVIAAMSGALDTVKEPEEIMVASVADRLNIDPSRASRLISEAVNAGYVRRVASQRDSRRTILELTNRGWNIVSAVMSYKWLLLSDFLASWSDEALESFVPQLERYVDWVRTSEAGEKRFAGEIAALSKNLNSSTQEN